MEGKTEIRMTSAASFVEGGIQESCDDACSICLEEFCASDPSTVISTFVSRNCRFSNILKSKSSLFEKKNCLLFFFLLLFSGHYLQA